MFGRSQEGIVFIDEIDKICSKNDFRGSADASSEGVQRDLLPLLEGSQVQTKHGNINTDHILFVASGAFHYCKPSDLLAELQGRLPIRVPNPSAIRPPTSDLLPPTSYILPRACTSYLALCRASCLVPVHVQP